MHWTGFAVDGAAITEYQIFYNYNNQGWTEWSTFPAAQTTANFPFLEKSLGDGLYQFEATATDSAGRTKARSGTAEATILVDLADLIQPIQFLPVLSSR